MKKLFLISAIFLSAFTYKAEAQVNVNINIGNQPIWGPVGYDYVDYYYLPDLDVYYYVPQQQFVYFDFGRWIFAASLPPRYGRYDLFSIYKVVINDRDPWLRNTYYRDQYRGFRGRHQSVIRDSRDQKYFVIRDHPEHDRFYNNQRNVELNRNGVNNRDNQIQNNQRNVELNRNGVNNRDNQIQNNQRNVELNRNGVNNRDNQIQNNQRNVELNRNGVNNRNNQIQNNQRNVELNRNGVNNRDNNRNQGTDNRDNSNRNNNRDHGNDGNHGKHH